MALKVDYVVRETATNLRRNVTLTLATIITIGVTLTLTGSALVIRKGVNQATTLWREDVEFIVFMQPDAQQGQLDAVRVELEESPQVKEITYIDHDGAYEEFRRLFADSPDLIDNITPDILPTSYKVVPRDPDSAVVDSLVDQFEKSPGVREVVAASDTIRNIEQGSHWLNWVFAIGAVGLGVTALVLIVNTIRMAMFARRREIEVMKLVGATNWFIRVPFMCEGLVQGLVGAATGIAGVFGLNWVFERLAENFGLFSSMVVETGELIPTTLILAGAGAAVGMIGSAVAVTRFLDV
ncbi:MAG: cell division protein FtsX [Acidimicrobiales bacterium]